MRDIQTFSIWNERQEDFCKLTDYLKNVLSELCITGAIVFGSQLRSEDTCTDSSDVDVVAYSGLFDRESGQKWIDYICRQGGDFEDKEPLYLEDFITGRIEYLYRIGNTTFDVNLFPTRLGGYEKRYSSVAHDSLELVIGAMYIHAGRLFGEIPFETLLNEEFLPYYSDDLRCTRMAQLEARVRSGLAKCRSALQNGHSNLLYQVYKTRGYLVKWLFIQARIYPVDLDRYLERQLSEVLGLPMETVDALLLRSGTVMHACGIFLNTAQALLDAAGE